MSRPDAADLCHAFRLVALSNKLPRCGFRCDDPTGTLSRWDGGQPERRVKVEIKKLAGAVAATTFMFSVGAIAPASAADDQVFGIQQAVTDPSGGEIAYTVTKLLPSEDAVPVSGVRPAVRSDGARQRDERDRHSGDPEIQRPNRERAELPRPRGRLDTTPWDSTADLCCPAAARAARSTSTPLANHRPASAYNGAGRSLSWIEPPAASEEEAATEEEAPADTSESGSAESGAPAESGKC